jgi:Trypsin-like serine proteases, typically periplasmic, contain C-terminal PDZ domain
MSQEASTGPGFLARLSDELAAAVALVAPSVVRVDDGSRLTATGVVWEADGVIVTTSHGTERDEELFVVTRDGARHAAQLLGRDLETDLAVLQVAAAGLTPVPRASAEDVRVGQLAVAVGEPGEGGLTATLGLVSSRQDTETAGQPEYILTTDAVLYPGFSGGPLVGADGRMLGLLNRLYGRGIGVALGVPLVARVAEAIRKHGTLRRGYLGVRTQLVNLPDGLRVTHGLAQSRGLLVVQVEPGSPAEAGGLMLGDTLLSLNNKAVEDVDALRGHLIAGQPVAVGLVRGGERRELTVTVGEGR